MAFRDIIGPLLVVYAVGTMVLIGSPYAGVQWVDVIFPVIYFSAEISLGITFRIVNYLKRERSIAIWVAAYVLVNIFSALVSGELSSVLEAVGRCYLILMCLTLRVLSPLIWARSVHRKRLLLGVVFVVVGVTILGYLMYFVGISEHAMALFPSYPYLGDVFRLKGYTPSPAFLLTFVALPMIYLTMKVVSGKYMGLELGLLCLLAFIAFCTLSKSLVLLLAMLWLGVGWLKKWRGVVQFTLPACLVFFHIMATHVIVVNNEDAKSLHNTYYTSNVVLAEYGDFQLWESSYSILKRKAIPDDVKTWLVGVGPGNFNLFLDLKRSRGDYPAHLPLYDPHSTYFGGLIETGLPGLLLILVFWGYWYRRAWRQLLIKRTPLTIFIFLATVYFILEGISMDIMNFRHLWVFMAIMWGHLEGVSYVEPLESNP